MEIVVSSRPWWLRANVPPCSLPSPGADTLKAACTRLCNYMMEAALISKSPFGGEPHRRATLILVLFWCIPKYTEPLCILVYNLGIILFIITE